MPQKCGQMATPNNNSSKKRCCKTSSHNILPCNSNACKHCNKTGGLKTEIRIVPIGFDVTFYRRHLFGSQYCQDLQFPPCPFTNIVTSHNPHPPPRPGLPVAPIVHPSLARESCAKPHVMAVANSRQWAQEPAFNTLKPHFTATPRKQKITSTKKAPRNSTSNPDASSNI